MWHHGCAVYNANVTNDKIIYMNGNGEVVSTDVYGTGNNLGTGVFTRWGIVCDGSEADNFNGVGNNVFYDGLMDDMRIYDRAITQAEAIRLANGDTPQISRGTYTLQDAIDIDGDLIIHVGSLVANGNDITLAGSWVNTGGVFDEGSAGTVTFDGDDQWIEFSESFYNFSKNDASGSNTLFVGRSATVTVSNILSLSGQSGANRLLLRSSTDE